MVTPGCGRQRQATGDSITVVDIWATSNRLEAEADIKPDPTPKDAAGTLPDAPSPVRMGRPEQPAASCSEPPSPVRIHLSLASTGV